MKEIKIGSSFIYNYDIQIHSIIIARIKQLKKTQKEVNKIIRGLNKVLKEDCFAGRFKVLQTLRIAHHKEDDYYTSIYRFTFIDTEQPERIVEKWIDRMNEYGFTRSMSKKGCSPDNSACEGFFGRMKNEMFYGRNFAGVTIEAFIQIINDYIIWYNTKRLKASLGYMSPMEYRQILELT